MPILRQLPNITARGSQTTHLTIRKPFFSEHFAYRFSKLEFILANPDDSLEIVLIAHRSMRRYRMQIHEHCCTRPAAMKYLSKGQEQDPPVYEDEQQRATYKFRLDKRELVQIGIIVRLFEGTKYIGDLLCDPQVGNGPPSKGAFIPVDLQTF